MPEIANPICALLRSDSIKTSKKPFFHAFSYIAGMAMFACLAVRVTIWGAFDIKKMLQALNAEHETGATSPEEEN
jgi:hypothetical protein